MQINPYLSFNGQCREAFEFYEKTLGGKIEFIASYGGSPMADHVPASAQNHVMHVSLKVGDQCLQGADAPPGQFTQPGGFCVALHFADAGEGQRVFDALAPGGQIQMPFQETFWAKGFGMLIDRFGTPWTVNAGSQPHEA